MVLYKQYVFCSDMKFKMAATAGLSLALDPMGKNISKRFFSEITWTIETKLPRNDHWKVLYKFYVFLCRSEMQDGHHRNAYINIGPYGKMFKCLLLRNYKYD